jgi:hypothetical protein
MRRETKPDTEPATERTRRTWHLERSSPVRADAESMFVPASELPEASLGDTIVASSESGGDQRTGTVVDTSERVGEPFFRIEFNAG